MQAKQRNAEMWGRKLHFSNVQSECTLLLSPDGDVCNERDAPKYVVVAVEPMELYAMSDAAENKKRIWTNEELAALILAEILQKVENG